MTAQFCHLCGKPLTGMMHLLSHPRWPQGQALRICTGCYRTRPRCQVCGMPLADNGPQETCPTCLATVPHCLTCNRLVAGRSLVVDGVGPFCEACHQTRQPCDICGAPLSDERWQLSDGRLSCVRCHSTAVYTPVEAGAIYDEVRQVIEGKLGLRLNIPTGLALVDCNQLREILLQQSDQDEQLDPARTLGVYLRKGRRRGMYAQTGLPAGVLIHVLAHEYAHAWQGENCPLLRDPLLREGFAEWVAYRVLEYYRLDQRLLVMRQRSGDVYAQGLHLVLGLEEQTGQVGVIEACRASGRPSSQANGRSNRQG